MVEDTSLCDEVFNHMKTEDRMLKWFETSHLPDNLAEVSKKFQRLADDIVLCCVPGPERTVCLRKLLESKDAAVRAAIHFGG